MIFFCMSFAWWCLLVKSKHVALNHPTKKNEFSLTAISTWFQREIIGAMPQQQMLRDGAILLRCTYNDFCLFWAQHSPPPQWARNPLFTRFLDHTQRRTTVGRTPLDKWSARRRDNTQHNRQTSMPSVGFEPTISVGERLIPATYSACPA